MSETDLSNTVELLARTLWGESRGEGHLGMCAVAGVIVNRAHNPRWWGSDIRSVCLKPFAFSCWLASDPNKTKMLAVTQSDPAYADALSIAAKAVCGTLVDVTNGADSYYAAGSPEPAWAEGKEPCAVIGRHRFYRIELGQTVVAKPLPTPAPDWQAPWMKHPVAPQPTADALMAQEQANLSGQDVEAVSAVS